VNDIVCVSAWMCLCAGSVCVCVRARQLVHCCMCVVCCLGDVGCEVGMCFICLHVQFSAAVVCA